MKAIILNSGIGSRMGDLTENSPKCLLSLKNDETIVSRQVQYLMEKGVKDIIITTGRFHEEIKQYLESKFKDVKFHFVNNDQYASTNYIYSMYLLKNTINENITDGILLLHGDLVFDREIVSKIIDSKEKNMVIVSTSESLPLKDFKGYIENGYVRNISIDMFTDCKFLLPLYKLDHTLFSKWMEQIEMFIQRGETKVYAEDALNEVLAGTEELAPCYFSDGLCQEIDTFEDYTDVLNRLD